MRARMTLREYMHRKGLRGRPPCFYCGLKATTLDHVKPRSAKGRDDLRNVEPACHRCNMRKGPLSLNSFRAKVHALWEARYSIAPLNMFFGEGVAGKDLRRLRAILKSTTRSRTGELQVLKPGERLSRPRSESQREKDRARPRWAGRQTMEGRRALDLLSTDTGASYIVVERFLLGLPTIQTPKLKAACKKLHLNTKKLRALKPAGKPVPREARPRRSSPALVLLHPHKVGQSE